MADYADSHQCRRKELLAWFGEDWPHLFCGACDNCEAPRERFDATVEAQKLSSCIIRIHQHDLGHANLTTYGIGANTSANEWMSIGRQLIPSGHIATSDDRWQTVSVSARGREALTARRTFLLTRLLVVTVSKADSKGQELAHDEGLFQALRALRKAEADTWACTVHGVWRRGPFPVLPHTPPFGAGAHLR